MDKVKLGSFIKRIVMTSPDTESAEQALNQLRLILNSQLKTEDQNMIFDALSGIKVEFDTMKSVMGKEKEQYPDVIQKARAAAIRRRAEMDSHGRC